MASSAAATASGVAGGGKVPADAMIRNASTTSSSVTGSDSQPRAVGRARCVPDPADNHGEQRGTSRQPPAHRSWSTAGQRTTRRQGPQVSQAEGPGM